MKMNEITRCLKDYKFKSIFLKNLRMLLLLILIPLMGIVSLTYYSYERIERKNRETFYHEEVMKAMFDVDRCFQEAKNQMMYVVHNQSTELFFYLDANDINAYDNISRTNELIQMSVVNNNFIRDLCIYSAEHKQVLSGQGVSLAEHYQYRDCLTNADTVTSGELRLSQSGLAYPKQLISLYYKFDFGNTRKGLGITSIDPEMLLKEISVRLPEVSLTLKGGILASSDGAQTGQPVPEWMAQASQSKKEFFIHDNKQYLRTVSPRFGYEMFAEMDRELYAAHSAGMDGWMLTLLFFMLGLTVLLCFYFSKQIFSPIQSIFSLLEKNRMLLTGEEILRAEDEIKYIETTIQRTIFKAEDVDKELNERIQKLKKVQAQALQSQINPHFVNNTLDHIKWYSITKLGSENEIVEIAEALSGMLRVALESNSTIVPISQEIDHVKMYLCILQKRHPNRFDVVWDIPQEVLTCKTIRIILQPLVENAFQHGIKGLSQFGHITVCGRLENDEVHLSVADNGLGMNDEELRRVMQQMKSKDIPSGIHIGMNNVHQRIQLYFGDAYGISIQSTEYFGTQVSVRFPKL